MGVRSAAKQNTTQNTADGRSPRLKHIMCDIDKTQFHSRCSATHELGRAVIGSTQF